MSKPILFSGAMVRAILDGRKTQTRRVVKPPPKHTESWTTLRYFSEGLAIECGPEYPDDDSDKRRCPYGAPGNDLWVREGCIEDMVGSASVARYMADDALVKSKRGTIIPWWGNRKSCPSIHMPKTACRLFLKITNIRVERLQDINPLDAIAEGIQNQWDSFEEFEKEPLVAVDDFSTLWDSINEKKHPWESNPWVWVVEFERANQ